MDYRKGLETGTVLEFPGMSCTIRKEIGRGSNTIVYQSSYPDLVNRNMYHKVLVKEFFPYDAGGEIFRETNGSLNYSENSRKIWEQNRICFERENQIHVHMMLKYPEIDPKNLNTFANNNTFYTVIGYTNGRSLEQDCKKSIPTLRVIAARMIMLLNVLSEIHKEGYLYLDIGPDNILLTGSGMTERIFLIDYNCVHESKSVAYLKAGSLLLKSGFTAPEVRAGNITQISEKSDLYSVAAVFYFCLTGVPLTLFQMIRRGPPELEQCPGLLDVQSREREIVKRILWRGLQTIPSRRYVSAVDMMQDFYRILLS